MKRRWGLSGNLKILPEHVEPKPDPFAHLPGVRYDVLSAIGIKWGPSFDTLAEAEKYRGGNPYCRVFRVTTEAVHQGTADAQEDM